MSNFICKKCGSAEYEIKDKPNGTGIAHGLYCAKCGFWHKWIGKEELKKYKEKECKDEIILKLQSENAQLRARLEKAVELPFSIGNMAYYCEYINGKGYCLIERKIVGIKQIDNEPKWWDRREKIMVAIVQGEKDDGEIGEWCYDIGAFGTEWGIEKSIFEKQLSELKGENNDD